MQVIERSDHGTVSPRMTRIITASRFIRAARTATGGTSRWTPTRSTMPEWREGDGWRRTSEGLPSRYGSGGRVHPSATRPVWPLG